MKDNLEESILYCTLKNPFFEKIGKVYYGIKPKPEEKIVLKMTGTNKINPKDFFIFLEIRSIPFSETEYDSLGNIIKSKETGTIILCSFIYKDQYFHDIESELIIRPFDKIVRYSKLKKSIEKRIRQIKKNRINLETIKEIINQEIEIQVKDWEKKTDKKIEELTGKDRFENEKTLKTIEERDSSLKKFIKSNKWKSNNSS